MEDEFVRDNPDDQLFDWWYQSKARQFLFFDITIFFTLLKFYFEAINVKQKRTAIKNLLNSNHWRLLYKNKNSGCCVYAENENLEHDHELKTAKALAERGYHVLFAPKAMFRREDKKFDVFLIRGHIMLRADLKNIISKNPETIANRIAEGGQQASRVVVFIQSDLKRKALVNGLRDGIERSYSLKEIYLFYKNRFFQLNRKDINSNKIYKLL